MIDNYVTKLAVGGAAAVALPSAVFFLWREFSKRGSVESAAKLPSNGASRSHEEKFVFIEEQFVGVVLGKHLRHLRRIENETKSILNLVAYRKDELDHNGNAAAAYERRNSEWVGEEGEMQTVKSGNLHFIRIHAQNKEQIRLAEMAIEALVIDAKRRKCREEMKVPAESLGMIIGKHGAMIKKIGRMFRCRIQIVQEGDEFETVHLEGTPEGIESAKTHILSLVDRSTGSNCDEERDAEEEIKDMLDLKKKLEAKEEWW